MLGFIHFNVWSYMIIKINLHEIKLLNSINVLQKIL